MDEPKRQKMTLFDPSGARKYLNEEERQAFLKAAATQIDRQAQTFCMTLNFTGCRISEATALSGNSIDFSGKMVVFESLKKRRRGDFRAVPVPDEYLTTMDLVHGLRDPKNRKALLWGYPRRTATRRVEEVMALAGLDGVQATAKGLRHGFAVGAVNAGVPLTTVQKWLGHADLETTAIYTNAMGKEEYELAKRMWG